LITGRRGAGRRLAAVPRPLDPRRSASADRQAQTRGQTEAPGQAEARGEEEERGAALGDANGHSMPALWCRSRYLDRGAGGSGAVIFHNKCDWVDETSNTYSHNLIIKNATARIHSATGLILSIFNATGLTIT